MMTDILDYRNGKYQGPTTSNHQRHGLGIFIDDDLTFYISQWRQSKLNGPTLIYLTHGKYIYGEWKNNEPHGLNIYRSGDTVLLGKFKDGLPAEKCLMIFERENFACIINQVEGQDWTVGNSGIINSHSVLLSFISKMGISVPDHYFSLTKFASSLPHRNKAIKMFPCPNNHCYFGFVNGLGIIFNSNNGVVSVGCHQKESLCQFGGKFQGMNSAEEGNFEPQGQTIKYKRIRPACKINNIFQNIHKKSINFFNQYFDSRSKIFTHIEQLLRNKVRQINETGLMDQDIRGSIEESLQFRQYNEQQSFRNYQNREKMYSPPKKHMNTDKSPSRQCSNGPYRSPLAQKINNTSMKKSLTNFSQSRTEIAQPKQFKISSQDMINNSNSPYIQHASRYTNKKSQKQLNHAGSELRLLSEFSRKVYLEKNSEQEEVNIRKKQQVETSQKSPTFKILLEEMQHKYRQKDPIKMEKKQDDPSSQSRQISPALRRTKSSERKSIARPSYEQIEDRRRRVLQQFQNNVIVKKQTINQESPGHNSRQSKQSNFEYVPLSISTRIKQKAKTPIKPLRKEAQAEIHPNFKRKPVQKETKQNVYPLKMRQTQQKQAKPEEEALSYFKKQTEEKINPEPIRNSHKSVIHSHQQSTQSMTSNSISSVSPSRQKKTYVYLFE